MGADDEAAGVLGSAGGAGRDDSDESWEDRPGDCENCKWMMGLGYNCLLGRSRERCNNNPARRGDDELVERLLNLSDDQRAKLRSRLELETEATAAPKPGIPPDTEDGL